jgi:hypothetical protein
LLLTLLKLTKYYRSFELKNNELEKVLSALQQYFIQVDAFPNNRLDVIMTIIKQHAGKDLNFQSLSSDQQKQVCIIACVTMFLMIMY